MTGPNGVLVLMVGAPGSGKSMLVADRVPAGCRFSLDAFRAQLAGDCAALDATPPAVKMLKTAVRYRAEAGLFTVVDATNARREHRTTLRRIAKPTGAVTVAVLMHTPLEVCLARQAGRAAPYPGANPRPVREDVVRHMWEAIAADPPTPSEFDIVVHAHPTDPARLIAKTRGARPWAQSVLASHQFMPDVPVIDAFAPLPWSARG